MAIGRMASHFLMPHTERIHALRKPLKVGVVVAFTIGGLAAFGWKYQSYFAGGTRSVNAPSDY